MGKIPFANPNPKNPSKRSQFHQFHAPSGDYNGCQIDESPAVTQTASDDASSINHRRSSELNFSHSQYVSFNIGSYSKKELGDLKNRLMSELDRIRQLQSRIESTDLHHQHPQPKKSIPSKKMSGSKRPFPTNSNHGKDSSNLKRSHVDNANLMKNCAQLMTKLMKQKHAWIFNKPVDVIGMGLHDYYDIIKQPMDLGTVKSNLSKNLYSSPSEFADHVRLTFQNGMTYNPKGHDVHAIAEQLLLKFEELYRPVSERLGDDRPYDDDLQASSWEHVEPERPKKREEKKPEPPVRAAPALAPTPAPAPAPAPASSSNPIHNSPHLVQSQSPVRTPSPPMRAPPVKPLKQPKPKAKDPNKREMSMEEKHKLGIGLQSLPQEKMDQVVQIIRKRNGHLKQDGDEIELDIEAVDTETLWELDRLVTNWKKMVSKMKRQALMNNINNNNISNVATNKGNAVSVAVLANQLNLPNLMTMSLLVYLLTMKNLISFQKELSEKVDVAAAEPKRVKKGEAGDEDVDIGDDMPMNNFPPVEIEKDVGGVGGHASSSSSSGSSSSSSDSSSSSGITQL